MKFDDVLGYLGEFGTFQKRIYFLLCLFGVTHGMRMVVLVFILSLPKHRCAIPFLANDTYEVDTFAHELLFNKTIPPDDSCHVYKPDNYTYDLDNRPINATIVSCDRWVYDTSVFASTVARQFDLVCANETKRSHATMAFYCGFLIGVIVLGAVSDIIGRKRSLFLSLTLLLLLGIGLAYADSFLTFILLNFLVGASTTGIFSSAFVIAIELVGPSKRTYSGMLIQLFFSSGVVGLAGLAYLLRDWQHLQLAITVPLVLFYLSWCIIPESPRWQIQRGKFSEARATINYAAKVNNRKLPEHILNKVMPLENYCKNKAMAYALKELKHCGKGFLQTWENGAAPKDLEMEGVDNEEGPEGLERERLADQENSDMQQSNENRGEGSNRLVDLFKSKVLCVRTCILFFNWTVVSLTFYGLNFNTGNLGAGSIFLNFFLAGLVEFPAHITTIFTIDRLGRKSVHCAMMSVSGIACLLCVISMLYTPPDHQWLTVALAMLGKFGAAGGFGTIYLYSTELYPTLIRNSALGASSSWARVGAMLAPYVAAQGAKADGPLGRGIPLLICGTLVLAAGLVSLLLPETLNRRLPETVQDAENLSKYKKRDSSNSDKNLDARLTSLDVADDVDGPANL